MTTATVCNISNDSIDVECESKGAEDDGRDGINVRIPAATALFTGSQDCCRILVEIACHLNHRNGRKRSNSGV